MKKPIEILPEYEVSIVGKDYYKISRIINAKNEYEAVLEMADYVGMDFDLYYSDENYTITSVTLLG